MMFDLLYEESEVNNKAIWLQLFTMSLIHMVGKYTNKVENVTMLILPENFHPHNLIYHAHT